jgi:hypothetical protein
MFFFQNRGTIIIWELSPISIKLIFSKLFNDIVMSLESFLL